MHKATITLPESFILELEAWTNAVAHSITELRKSRGLSAIPKSQTWYWTKKWQDMEQEADQAIARGDIIRFENVDQAIEHLDTIGS